MQWYEMIKNKLESEKLYSHKELMAALRQEKPDLADSTYHWAISGLVRDGILVRKGYDAYSLSNGVLLADFYPIYSEAASKLICIINTKYPYVQFTIFETVLMNDFLNHLIAQNTIFIQVEKESSIFVFRFLQEEGYQNIMYKPNRTDFDLYWSRDSIVVTDLISEAPVRSDEPHVIMLEKMLVDMCADKLISTTYSKAEFPAVIEQAERQYCLDKTRMLRYARRRNRQEELKKYLEGSTIENAST